MRNRLTTWCVAVLLFAAHGQAEPGLQWRLLGPFRGGRVVAATGVPGEPATFYFGAVGGGIWKSTDAGMVWKPIFDKQNVASIGALAVAPSNAQVIYAGTGEADIRSDISFGNGMYRSDDAGGHWLHIGLENTKHIARIVVDPANPDVVYVAALGHAYAANAERGVFRTQDGGKTWERVLDKGPEIGAADISMDPENSRVLYATMWRARRTSWSQYAPEGGAGSGLFKSADAGSTWVEVTGHGLPVGEWGRAGVAGARGGRVYALVSTRDAKDGGLFRSDDAGLNWLRVSDDSRLTGRAWYFSFIAVDPSHPDVVYVPNVAVMKSSDGGVTFTVLRGAPGGDDYHSIWIDPANSAHLILGTDQGASVSLNEGATWSSWYNQPTGQFYHVVTDNAVPYNVCGSQQDSGTACVPSSGKYGAITERDFFTVGGNEAGWVAPDPRDANIYFATDTYGSVTRFDRRTAQAQNVSPGRQYRAPWTPALVFSPADPDALYMGTQYLLKTTDGGLNWNRVSDDLTGDPKGVVYSIAPSALKRDQVWFGTDTGRVELTRDGGKTWANVTPPGLTLWSKITHVEASHFDAGEAWVAVDRHRLDDYNPHLFRTRDFGKTWTPITANIPDGAFLNAVREDPKRRGLLFAATETGVWLSRTDGDQWEPLRMNLPVTSVRDLTIHGNDLVIATHGRGFWVLDDIASLREPGPAATHLFAPSVAVRQLTEAFHGTPLPPEVPAASNPPSGAVLDYWLTRSTPVTIEIVDRKGVLVRRISSDDVAPPLPKNVSIAPMWLIPPPSPTAAAGSNRYVWDLRYAGPQEEVGSDESEAGPMQGPLVSPGDYTVRLIAGGAREVRTLHVMQDPRAPVAQEVLDKQRDLALDIVALLGRAKKSESTRGPDLTKLKQIEQELGAALAAITSADREPTAQSIKILQEARVKLSQLQ